MLVDDSILLFRSATGELENPQANDILYLNACMWIYDKVDGVIVYITGDRKETTFSLTRTKRCLKKLSEESECLHDLLKEQKTPILEPSSECSTCQYYERCFMKREEYQDKCPF